MIGAGIGGDSDVLPKGSAALTCVLVALYVYSVWITMDCTTGPGIEVRAAHQPYSRTIDGTHRPGGLGLRDQ